MTTPNEQRLAAAKPFIISATANATGILAQLVSAETLTDFLDQREQLRRARERASALMQDLAIAINELSV